MPQITSATLADEFAGLSLPRFTEAEALRLGALLVEAGMAARAPIVIDIRTADRTLFHAALPGATPVNDLWARRKSATALMFLKPSFLMGLRHAERGGSLDRHGLDAAAYSDHGGAVPVVVAGAVVAVATISGLAQEDDHAMVVTGLRRLQAEL